MTAADAQVRGAVREFAPAKINLTLHVTGQRGDGYHMLDSLVVFADVGDWITVSPSEALRLRITGPFCAGVPVDHGNLVLRAAAAVNVATADILLEKNLPSAAGIGGGSSDAAALLRAVRRSHGVAALSLAEALSLGADVPMCLEPGAVRVSGIGDRLQRVNDIPPLPAVLVNPGVAVPTGEVFRALTAKGNPPMPPFTTGSSFGDTIGWLRRQRNDLQPPAILQAPVIAEVLKALDGEGALLSRMSGSGATCFGLFDSAEAAQKTADRLKRTCVGWWVARTTLNPGRGIASPDPEIARTAPQDRRDTT
ncbi:4-(cytidine 5'-diphospho)-2-C-methyl-D-erythritol kinase [Sedimentitalea sp. JM2-8]|uniref:4-diphosphocytidyl-2-C-methyl-D-erythritol kinase n=1 Tax=Sedimentitalea xiamensis TaxID=3050037 RepID=A0ABT7FE06_9RHOB|nr:4-(cytidine 5'-diphospho)-2-C-methyl-D-erythritol kinase [Sedimentitalea xiamensis]MDK3073351.1 4-(cytidine 5'-diphospho)-2-C-methyl-D-erythritol kinase [Sedimentitalea xiamensis]